MRSSFLGIDRDYVDLLQWCAETGRLDFAEISGNTYLLFRNLNHVSEWIVSEYFIYPWILE